MATNWLNKYVIIRKNKTVVFLGLVLWQKKDPVCISYDNIHFFSTKNLNIQESLEYIGHYQNIAGLITEKWRNKNIDAELYLEREIDIEIVSLVTILNKKWHTTGSCCGHNKTEPWVELQIHDYDSLLLLTRCIQDPWCLEILDSNKNMLNIRLKAKIKNINVIQNLEKFLRDIFNM